MSNSIYEPLWQAMKVAGAGGIEFNLRFDLVEEQSGTPLSEDDKTVMFNRVRKALSKRKSLDLEFGIENPAAKLAVTNTNYATGSMSMCLRHTIHSVSMIDLVAPSTQPIVLPTNKPEASQDD